MKLFRGLALLVLLFQCTLALAAPRAWLDRERIALGETVTLNIESDERGAGAPDFAPLGADFDLQGSSSNTQTTIVNGRATTRTLYAVALSPKRDGVIGIPPLRVGSARTEPLSLTVLPAAANAPRAGDPVFLEAEIETRTPYVRQAVAYTVRLYYAVTLLDGQLEAEAPDGASLQRVGDDVTYQRSLADRRYNVVERRFLLVPERSGKIELPAPRFRGRALGGSLDSFFGDGRSLAINGDAQTLDVRAQPAGAPQPWLPATRVVIDADPAPTTAKAGGQADATAPRDAVVGDRANAKASHDAVVGEPVLLTLTVRATGATAAMLPDLQFPAVAGAQVFPEPPDTKEQWRNGRIETILTRRFAIVPQRAGELQVPPLKLGWWDTRADRARTAALAGFKLGVSPAAGTASAADGADAGVRDAFLPSRGAAVDGGVGAAQPWRVATFLLALLCIALAVWGWRRGAATAVPTTSARSAPAPSAASARSALPRALREGDLQDIADALLACPSPPTRHLGELAVRLAEPAQRDAVVALERALWSGDARAEDRAAVRERLRAVFGSGPRFTDGVSAQDGGPLPPLYPRR